MIGLGYRPRTGAVFFTRNGKKLDEAYIGLNRHNLFPTVGADGAASIHVNLGQAGFVFIEANVKKWGLAPMIGTLAPPPAYGSERGSILLQTAGGQASTPPSNRRTSRRHRNRRSSMESPTLLTARSVPDLPVPPSQRSRLPIDEEETEELLHPPVPRRTGSTDSRTSTQTDSSDNMLVHSDNEDEDSLPHNPPTPNLLDISLHSLNPFASRRYRDREEYDRPPPTPLDQPARPSLSASQSQQAPRRAPSPPAYHIVDPNVRSHFSLLS